MPPTTPIPPTQTIGIFNVLLNGVCVLMQLEPINFFDAAIANFNVKSASYSAALDLIMRKILKLPCYEILLNSHK